MVPGYRICPFIFACNNVIFTRNQPEKISFNKIVCVQQVQKATYGRAYIRVSHLPIFIDF